MSGSAPKRHHYVPQFLLEGFTNSRGMLFVFDKNSKKTFEANPLNTAVIAGYYTITGRSGAQFKDIEPMFAYIEGKAKPIIKKIDGQLAITKSEKELLALFLAFQFTRVPQFEKQIDEAADIAYKIKLKVDFGDPAKAKKNMDDFTKETGEVPPMSPEKISSVINRDGVSTKLSRGFNLNLALKIALEIGPLLAAMKWQVFKAPKGSVFITTDKPFVVSFSGPPEKGVLSSRGLLSPGATKFFPLSQSTCLAIQGFGDSISGGTIRKKAVRNINLMIASHALRYIFASPPDLLKNIIHTLKLD